MKTKAVHPFLKRIQTDRLYTIGEIHKLGVMWWLSSYRTTHEHIHNNISRGKLKAISVQNTPTSKKWFIEGKDLLEYMSTLVDKVN